MTGSVKYIFTYLPKNRECQISPTMYHVNILIAALLLCSHEATDFVGCWFEWIELDLLHLICMRRTFVNPNRVCFANFNLLLSCCYSLNMPLWIGCSVVIMRIQLSDINPYNWCWQYMCKLNISMFWKVFRISQSLYFNSMYFLEQIHAARFFAWGSTNYTNCIHVYWRSKGIKHHYADTTLFFLPDPNMMIANAFLSCVVYKQK